MQPQTIASPDVNTNVLDLSPVMEFEDESESMVLIPLLENTESESEDGSEWRSSHFQLSIGLGADAEGDGAEWEVYDGDDDGEEGEADEDAEEEGGAKKNARWYDARTPVNDYLKKLFREKLKCLNGNNPSAVLKVLFKLYLCLVQFNLIYFYMFFLVFCRIYKL